ncbi:MAG: Ig-like domain-containing protein [Chitinophagales bacterium]
MSKIYYLPRFIANGVLRNLNRVFLFSLFSLFIPLLSFAEGSAQLNPNASDLALIQVNSASFGPGIAYVGAPDIERLYFSIENPTSELVYFGFALPYTVNGVATTNAFGFQVRNSAGTVVHGPFTINNSNVNITGTEAARQTLSANGPNVLGAGGYSVTATSGPNFIYIFNPASFGAGDYYVEIGTVSGGVLNFSTADQYFRHFDITVTNNPATARINGRAYCKNWTIRTPCNGCPGGGTFDRSFTGKVYIYEDSGFVSSIDFASATFAGLGFELAFNSTGPNSGGTVADNRKSVEGLSTLPVYKVFLNDPDITLYPSGPVGSVLDGPRAVYNGACVSSNICFEYTVSEPGIIELLLDFDQASGAGLYDPGTADVLLVGEAIGSGPISGCVAWDGLDGLGSPVSDISGLTFELNYSQAPTHFMMYDVERVNPGFALIPERPFISGYVADFFHDSENIPDNPLVGTTNKLELNGCSPYCQEWNLNTGSPANGFGESNTINSWWYGNRISSVQVAASQPNCPPIANNDLVSTNEDTPVTVDVLNNDTDTESAIDTVFILSNPSNGSLGTTSVNPATGEITYTPNANFNGTDSFTYVVCDDGTPLPSTCDTATVVITINAINDALVALDDASSTNEDTPVTVDVLNNDSDVDGNLDPSSVAEVTAPMNGTTSVNPATGEITYTPDANFNGVDSFTYVVCDDGTPLPAMCDTATVVVTVVAVNDNVVAVDDAATTDEDTPVTVDVLNNDSDVDGNLVPSSVAEVTAPANGTTSVNPATGEITYTPDANFNGVDSFTYVVCDDGTPLPSTCDTATVMVTIAPINDQPVALDDSASTNEDTPVTVDVLNNDSDVDGNLVPSSVAEVTAPANGTTSVNPATGEITYTPNANFNGVDSFTYVVCDDGTPLPSTCDTATVLLTILPVNDPPIAIGDSETTLEDTPIDILVLINDSDLEGPLDTTTVNVLTGPMNGTVVLNSDGSITYTPNTNYFGNDSFIYEVCDLGSPILCDTAIVTISIEGVIDTSFVTIEEDSTVLLCTTNFINVGGPIDNIQICAAPNNGTIAPSFLPCLNYTPDNNYVGMDTICVISCFGAICDTSVFVIDITPVNDTIIANDDFANTLEDQSVVIDLTVNDLDPDGLVDTASIVITSNPINGGTLVVNADGTVVYTPAPDFVGLDQFTYSVCDFGVPVLCDEALVTITVLSQPDTSIYTVPEDSLVIICTNDLTNFADPIDNIQICANPTNGTLTPSFVPCVSYMPNPNELGPDSFCVISCANGFCDTSYIIINVIPKNDGPTAIDENVSTTEDTPIDILILANDFDSDGLIDSTSVTIVSGPSNGSLVIDPLTGLVTYTPNANFVGTDSFIYSVCDDGTPVLCDEALVTITILPETDTIYVSVPEDGEIDICTDVNLNFANPITGISLCDLPENGDVAPSFIPCVTYTPGADFSGFDTLCVITCAGLICDTSIVIIEVVPVPDEPIVAVEDTVILEIAEIASFNVFDNDSLNDQAIETVVNILLAPINGSVELGSNGVALYTPFTDAAQADSFLYTVCQYLVDGEELCDTAWVYIFVGGDIIIPEGFTPNGDGLNDAFIIPNLQVVYPGASLKIFNRWGDEVYNSRGAYLSDWKGDNFNGNQLPDGTYFYILELNNDAKESIASYVVIYR